MSVQESQSLTVAERVGEFLHYLRMNQGEVAEQIGVRRATVSDWVRGKVPPDDGSLAKLSMLGEDTRDCYRWLAGGGPVPAEMVNRPVGPRSMVREVSPHASPVATAPHSGTWVAPITVGDELAEPPALGTASAPNELLDMKRAAQKVSEAIGRDLLKSEVAVLLDGATELGRQRAMVWALKDLARQLHHLGFDMRNLFAITDELAGQVGLAIRTPNGDSEKERST